MLAWITSFLVQLDNQSPTIQDRRTWQTHPTKHLEDPAAIRMSNSAIMSRHCAKNDFEGVLVPVKPKKDHSDARQAAVRMVEYVHGIFEAQPTRGFSLGLHYLRSLDAALAG